MKDSYLLKDLKALCELPGPSGREDLVASFLFHEITALGIECKIDALGSVIAHYPSPEISQGKVLVCGHMDEVGFLVLSIYDNGLIKAKSVGGMNTSELAASRVKLVTKQNKEIRGCISATAPHLLSESNVGSEDLYFDFGFTSKKEAERSGVSILDMIVFDEPFVLLKGKKRFLTKAFDDRYGCALGLSLLKDLVSGNVQLPFSLSVAFSVQEEVGCRGMGPIINHVHPDVCIIVDSSPSRDNQESPSGLGILDKGILIRYLDRAQIFYKPLLDWQIKMCEKANVPYQMYNSLGSTDSGVAHKHLSGVFSFVHGVAVRNIHSPSGVASVKDYIDAYKVLRTMIENIDSNLIAFFKKGGIE